MTLSFGLPVAVGRVRAARLRSGFPKSPGKTAIPCGKAESSARCRSAAMGCARCIFFDTNRAGGRTFRRMRNVATRLDCKRFFAYVASADHGESAESATATEQGRIAVDRTPASAGAIARPGCPAAMIRTHRAVPVPGASCRKNPPIASMKE
jgi:hypothetical protein